MALPPIYCDFMPMLQPFDAELAEQDAHELLAQPPATIHSVDDYDSRIVK